jgi:hypothetical protein
MQKPQEQTAAKKPSKGELFFSWLKRVSLVFVKIVLAGLQLADLIALLAMEVLSTNKHRSVACKSNKE